MSPGWKGMSGVGAKVSVGTYALLAAVLMPALGPGWGAALAWVGAVLSTTLPAWRWTHRRHRSGA